MTTHSLSLTAANIKYLVVLNQLNQSQSGIRCVDIAETLRVTKPSVHAMMNTLKKQQLIHKDNYGMVHFTPLGAELAKRYAYYFSLVCSFLRDLLPDEQDGKAAAYAILAALPLDRLEKMCQNMRDLSAAKNASR